MPYSLCSLSLNGLFLARYLKLLFQVHIHFWHSPYHFGGSPRSPIPTLMVKFLDLPQDILLTIYAYITPQDLLTLNQVII